jgi:hypothetical protein
MEGAVGRGERSVVRVDPQVLLRVADQADAVRDWIEVHAEDSAVGKHPVCWIYECRNAIQGIDDIEPTRTADPIEQTSRGSNVDAEQSLVRLQPRQRDRSGGARVAAIEAKDGGPIRRVDQFSTDGRGKEPEENTRQKRHDPQDRFHKRELFRNRRAGRDRSRRMNTAPATLLRWQQSA